MVWTLFLDPLRGLSSESLKYVPSSLVQTDKVQQNLHSWQNTLSLLLTESIFCKIFHFNNLVFLPDAAFVQSSSFSTLLGKVTILPFLTVLVTLVSIVLLGSVTTVVASIHHQIVNENLRFLQETHSLLCHLIIDIAPISTTFFINKTTGGYSSCIAVEQLSNL